MDIRVVRRRAEHASVTFALRDEAVVVTLYGPVSAAQEREALRVAQGLAQLFDDEAQDTVDEAPPSPESLPPPRPGWPLGLALAALAAGVVALVLASPLQRTARTGPVGAAPAPLPAMPTTAPLTSVQVPAGWAAPTRDTARAALVVVGAGGATSTPVSTTEGTSTPEPTTTLSTAQAPWRCRMLCIVVRHLPG